MNIFTSWTFTWWEVALLKICLFSVGILVGLYFADYVRNLMPLWWVFFVGPACYFIIRMVRGEMQTGPAL